MAKALSKRKPGRPRTVDHTKPEGMTGKQFATWQVTLGFTDSQAARALATSPSTVARYRTKGGSYLLGLACAAVAAGLSPWERAK